MEHSLLHALALLGLVIGTGGAILVLFLLGPGDAPIAFAIRRSAAKWVSIAATVAAIATFADLFSQVAEFRGTSVFGGAPLSEVVHFSTRTVTGGLSATRGAILLIIACLGFITRQRPKTWWLIGVLSLIATVLTALVSHAAAQPQGRQFALLVQIGHIAGAAVWLGVLFHLLAVRSQIQNAQTKEDLDTLARLVRRFSPIAILVVSLLLFSGLAAAFRFVSTPRAVFTSAYGLTLLVKLGLIVPAFYAGMVNHRLIRPKLAKIANSSDRTSVLQRFGRMLELEVTAGILLLSVAATLASISPPGQNPSLQLTERQLTAIISPKVPSLNIPDPAGFFGAPERNAADLAYSEFTHHASGIVVILLGLCWLCQGVRGRLGTLSGRAWPFLLIPFAGFVAVAADPEVWWLRRISLGQALNNPQLAEHQLGAAMVLLLVWLGWRDQRRPAPQRPLGYALPVILIFGGLLLMGHAHANLSENNLLSNLISVQHAIFGAFALSAGTLRWFSLRGLFSANITRWIWPTLIIGLGLFMTFSYRELTG